MIIKRIAIIDGDVLAYNACKPRWQSKAVQHNGILYTSLDSNGEKIMPEFTQEEDTKYLEESWDNFKKDLQKLLDTVYCTEYLMAVKGPGNYRDLMYPGYKANRHKDPTKTNHFVPIIRKLAIKEDLAIEADGREADDFLRIWANEVRAEGLDYVICSIDKDLKCIPGMHYVMHKEKLITISDEDAMRHYYEQLLKGDPTDNIPGVPQVGEVKAAKILASCKTEDEFQAQVINAYINAYGDDWYDFLLSNGKMIHLQEHPEDSFNFSKWPLVTELTE